MVFGCAWGVVSVRRDAERGREQKGMGGGRELTGWLGAGTSAEVGGEERWAVGGEREWCSRARVASRGAQHSPGRLGHQLWVGVLVVVAVLGVYCTHTDHREGVTQLPPPTPP